MGTKKGQRRKTARRAYMKKRGSRKKPRRRLFGGPRRPLADRLRDDIPDIFEYGAYDGDVTLFEYWTGIDYKTARPRRRRIRRKK